MYCYYIGDVDYNAGLYNVTLYNVTFPAGDVRVMFNVSITDDNILEMVEKFNLTISSTSLPSRIFSDDIEQTTVFITDNDGKYQLE